MSYVRSYHHLVFSTYMRKMTLTEGHKRELYMYIYGILKSYKCVLIRMNGIANHIHILINLHQDVALSKIVRIMKSSSSGWLKANVNFPYFEGWGNEYYAASISHHDVETVKKYIMNQEEHHHVHHYEDEIKTLVEEIGLVLYKDSDE